MRDPGILGTDNLEDSRYDCGDRGQLFACPARAT